MKVLIVTGIFPPDIGGPATYVPRIATALSDRGHQIAVVTLSDRVDHDDGQYPFRVTRIPRRQFRPLRWLRTVIQIVRLGRRVDVVFVNGLAKEAALAKLILRKPMVLKVVGDQAWEIATVRGWVIDGFEDFQHRRHGLRVEALKLLRTWWTHRADRLIANSEYMASWVVHWGIAREKLVVVYNSAESVEEVEPAIIPLKTPVNLVTVTRLVPWKRTEGLLEAIAQIDGVGLVIIGDGPERDHLQGLAEKLVVADRVIFAGQNSRPETLALMAASDVFVLNSSWESFAHAVLEAMALGVPVVATAVGGTLEEIEDGRNGLLVGPDHRSLVEAIRACVDDPELGMRFAEEGRAIVREKFGVETMVRRTERVLLETVDGLAGAAASGATR